MSDKQRSLAICWGDEIKIIPLFAVGPELCACMGGEWEGTDLHVVDEMWRAMDAGTFRFNDLS